MFHGMFYEDVAYLMCSKSMWGPIRRNELHRDAGLVSIRYYNGRKKDSFQGHHFRSISFARFLSAYRLNSKHLSRIFPIRVSGITFSLVDIFYLLSQPFSLAYNSLFCAIEIANIPINRKIPYENL